MPRPERDEDLPASFRDPVIAALDAAVFKIARARRLASEAEAAEEQVAS